MIATRPVDVLEADLSQALMLQAGLTLGPLSGATVIALSKRGDRLKFVAWGSTGLVQVCKVRTLGSITWPEVQDRATCLPRPRRGLA